MDFDLDDDQREILGAVDTLLERHAGATRAIELAAEGGYDQALDDALSDAGFTDLVREAGLRLEAALVVEAVARAAGVCAVGAAALVAPAIREAPFPGPVAMASADAPGPVRYAAHARTLLVLDAGARAARAVALAPGTCKPVASNFGYPMGAVSRELLAAPGEALPAEAADALARWWRLALTLECVGTMDAALADTLEYLKHRRQFGRTIGSFQAVQHRLAECAIQIEAGRWLAREAAHHGAPAEAVATAAAYALSAAGHVFAETHQLSGAIGFTREHDLHVWSMRLQALRLELGGVVAHRRALVAARWGAGSP